MVALAAMLSACGGGGGGSPTGATPTPSPTAAPTPTPVETGACSLRSRQDWALAQLREWYLFPETLPASLDPTPYATVDDYIDALTAGARAQGRDRYFTYLTSISDEDAFYGEGTSAGLGIRLVIDSGSHRMFVSEAFEGGAGLAAGIDRGTEIVGIGTTAANVRNVTDIYTADGVDGIDLALGSNTAGTTVLLRVAAPGSSTRDVFVTKSDFSLTPVSSRYGAKIIDDGGRRVGYVNLRTFINTADGPLRDAFAGFKAQGVTDVIVDLRYNGGGLVSIAELLSDLLGGGRSSADVVDYLTFRPEKASENSTRNFSPQPESVSPMRIAFIGTGGTASASELVINSFVPYLHDRVALIGANTYGKPVGQIALDRSECNDRLRVIALSVQNSARRGDYYYGLAGSMEASCQAADDIFHPLGDPAEASTRQALNYLAGQSCTRIASGSTGATLSLGPSEVPRTLLTPSHPDASQRQVPGLF